MSYYGLYIPVKTGNEQSDSPTVFREKQEALKILKQHKDARLREFNNTDDAAKYAQTGYEPSLPPSKHSDVKASSSTSNLEKFPFRAPTKPELVELKKLIESGDLQHVKALIWKNPRYLVSSGDTPTTLKEGCRYNALHICAISKRAQIAELILQTVSDTNFVELLGGKKGGKCSKELCAIMLDYYLNMPEKGRCETPLHLAVKIGAVDVVEVLTSYPECKMTANTDGMLPKDIICSRVADASPELRKRIQNLLEERFYVPVFRSLDGTTPPTIGAPFSNNSPPILKSDPLSPEMKIQAVAGPMNKEQAQQFCRRWKTPPRTGSSITSPIAQSPLISPVQFKMPQLKYNRRSPGNLALKRKALFASTAVTPAATSTTPRSQTSPLDLSLIKEEQNKHQHQNGNHCSSENSSQTTFASICNETNNNNNNNNNNNDNNNIRTPLFIGKNKELFLQYRDLVDSPLEPSTPMKPFYDQHCNDYSFFDTPGYMERNLKITDTEKGLEVIGRQLAKEQNVDWKEYWDFLGCLTDITSPEGLQTLEQFFVQRSKEEEAIKKKTTITKSKEVVTLDEICSALDKLGLCKDASPTNPTKTNILNDGRNGTINGSGWHTLTDGTSVASIANGTTTQQNHQQPQQNDPNYNNAPQSTSPYTCVEKSLQVFAKRMTKTILHNIDNIVSINDTFLSELKRLKSLICSFKDDSRFLNVNFSKVHSRFANLIVNYLESAQDVDDDAKAKIQRNLEHIIMSPGDRKEQLQCVCRLILNFMESDVEQINPENLKTEMMCTKVWLMESNCDCSWENGLIRKSSRRMRMEREHQTNDQQLNKPIVVNKNSIWRRRGNSFGNSTMNNNTNDNSDDSDEDLFLSDFCSDSEDESKERFYTPPESPSMLSPYDSDTENYNLFIYGNEPTKRDLDVLRALFHVEINKDIYPNIYSWKSAVLRYSNDDMDCFPSPSVILNTSIKKNLHPSPFDSATKTIDDRKKCLFPLLLPTKNKNSNNNGNSVENNDDDIKSNFSVDDSSGLSKNLSLMSVSESE